MPDINFLTLFHDREDKSTLRKLNDEVIELYGFPCVLRKWNGIQSNLDSLYNDMGTINESDPNLFDYVNTFVHIDYARFDKVLNSYGLALTENTSLEAMMRLRDKPAEDDIVEITYPYDNKTYRFKIGSADIHKDICYRVVLNVYYTEQSERKDLRNGDVLNDF